MSPYICEGYRLPTEAEFEKAARCGLDTLYAGSNDVDQVAWTITDSARGIGNLPYSLDIRKMPVRRLTANACGLYDLSGNVGEYSADMYTWPPTGRGPAATDPFNDSSPFGPTVRGWSAWSVSTEESARIATRIEVRDDYYGTATGFRLVRSVPR
jgi:formylglycine-generating enzyme required for sulfatase activity